MAVALNADTSWVTTEAISVGDTFTCLEVDHQHNTMNPSNNKTYFIVRRIDPEGILSTDGFYHDRRFCMTVEGYQMYLEGQKYLKQIKKSTQKDNDNLDNLF